MQEGLWNIDISSSPEGTGIKTIFQSRKSQENEAERSRNRALRKAWDLLQGKAPIFVTLGLTGSLGRLGQVELR